MIELRLYKNGWIELPNGNILSDEWLVQKLLESSKVPMTREKIREVMRLVYEQGSELSRYLVIENEEQKIRIEFMKDDLDTSANPALNN